MKLKKIASLALAGIMAVSMLAGCSGKGNTNENEGEKPSTSTVNVADFMNDKQTGSVKVKFTDDTALAAKLQQVVDVYGLAAINNTALTQDFKDAVATLANLKTVQPEIKQGDSSHVTWNDTFLSKDLVYTSDYKKEKGDLTGTYTLFDIVLEKGYDTKEAAMNALAVSVNNAIVGQGLAKQSATDGLKSGENYYGYEYNGTVAMVSVKNVDGTVSYIAVYTINQVVTEKTV